MDGNKNVLWCMNRFCDITRTSLQRIKPKIGRSPRLVELSEDMQGLLQVFQKVVSMYEELKRLPNELNTSESVNDIDDLEDTLSVISDKSGFSTGSQIHQIKDFEDAKYDSKDHNAAIKRMNFLARLEIPYQLFNSTCFDWTVKMYSQILEDLCDGVGDYTALTTFHKALQYRIDQNNLPESQRIQNVINSYSERENKFISSKLMLENQLKSDIQLKEIEIQRLFNQLEDIAHQRENDMSEEDSMAEDVSDMSDENLTNIEKSSDEITSHNAKQWLVQQYRNLGTKVVSQLDSKPIRTNGLYTVIGSIFRSIIMNLLRYATKDMEKQTNQNWFRSMFPFSRILKWNHFHFGQTNEMKRNLNIECDIFIDKLVDELLGDAWEKNPIAVGKRKELEFMLNLNYTEDDKNVLVNESDIRQEESSLQKELDFLSVYDAPVLNRQLFEDVLLYRDIGLIYEYPKEVSIHVILKFIKQPENGLVIGEKPEITSAFAKNKDMSSQIDRKDMKLATLILKSLKNEGYGNLGSNVLKYITDATIIIKEKSKTSIVNMFYMRQDTNDLLNVVRGNYKQMLSPQRYSKLNDNRINILLKYLSFGTKGFAHCEEPFATQGATESEKKWAMRERKMIRKLWNFKPFERKIKQLLNNPEDYGKLIFTLKVFLALVFSICGL